MRLLKDLASEETSNPKEGCGPWPDSSREDTWTETKPNEPQICVIRSTLPQSRRPSTPDLPGALAEQVRGPWALGAGQ